MTPNCARETLSIFNYMTILVPAFSSQCDGSPPEIYFLISDAAGASSDGERLARGFPEGNRIYLPAPLKLINKHKSHLFNPITNMIISSYFKTFFLILLFGLRSKFRTNVCKLLETS